MKKLLLAVLLPIFVVITARSLRAEIISNQQDNVTPVSSVDLKRYSGKWYEIAKIPNKFQKRCVGNTTANYSLKPDGNIEVINRCLKKDGQYDEAIGKAKIKDKTSNAKLEVRFAPAALSFIPQVWGDYWIIDLDSKYQYAVVGNPDRKYLWILSRTPEMDDAVYQKILRKVEKMGYNPNKLAKASQKVETMKGNIVERQ